MKKFATRTDFTEYLRGESVRQKTEEREQVQYEPPPTVTLSIFSKESPTKIVQKIPSAELLRACHLGRRRWNLSYDDGIPVAFGERLTRQTGYQVSRITKLIPKPNVILPPVSMPNWKTTDVSQKLPRLPGPPDAVWFCRGKLGKQICERKQTEYSVDDAYNNRRKLIRTPYNALHDPHARAYLEKPHVRNLLQRQGLVSHKGDVVCNVRQYNAYRQFVSEQYNEKLLMLFSDEQKLTKERNIQYDELKKFHKKQIAESHYLKKQSRFAKVREKNKKRRIRNTITLRDTVYRRKKKDMERQEKLNKVDTLKSYERKLREQYRFEAFRKIQQAAWDKKAKTIIRIMKNEQMTLARLRYDKEITRELSYLAKFERFKRQFKQSKKNIKFRERAQYAMETNLEICSKKRQIRYEAHRVKIQEVLDAEIKRRQYLKLNVRNYFRQWLERARSRIRNRPDDRHISAFPIDKLIEKYTRIILSKFENVRKRADFEIARKKLLTTMDETLNIDSQKVTSRAAIPAPSSGERMNLALTTHLMLKKKASTDESWRERWYQAHRNQKGLQNFLIDTGKKHHKKPKDYIHDNVQELKEMEIRNREQRYKESTQEDLRHQHEEAQHRHNLELAKKHRAPIDPNLANVGHALPEWVTTDDEDHPDRRTGETKSDEGNRSKRSSRRSRRRRRHKLQKQHQLQLQQQRLKEQQQIQQPKPVPKKKPKKKKLSLIDFHSNPRRKVKDLETEMMLAKRAEMERDNESDEFDMEIEKLVQEMIDSENENIRIEREKIRLALAQEAEEAAQKRLEEEMKKKKKKK